MALGRHVLARATSLHLSDDVLRGFEATIGARMAADIGVFRKDTVGAFEPCEKVATRVSAFSLVRHRTNDYSVPTWLMAIARSPVK